MADHAFLAFAETLVGPEREMVIRFELFIGHSVVRVRLFPTCRGVPGPPDRASPSNSRGWPLQGRPLAPTTHAEFSRLALQGAFCLRWTVHGLSYGIPSGIRARRDDEIILVILFRAVLATADQIFPNFIALRLSASAETLSRRLAAH